ncbi:MAG TPA: hypothetical protein PL048_20730, partial [Leptospiraceae bacterium]|nr:hypothetical protein [Leptospiraceae bacterium]HMZ61214.1 hypothetical protein [Leptospiraceae bacterium]HNH09864.1 hypothetical protein [Leptospiraceae bacterium]
YKYKPISQRGAHEVTGKTFEKKTGGTQQEHKNAVEKALQNGNRVSLHILRDYPDLIQKYGMGKRLERADKINAKVKEIMEKNQAKPQSSSAAEYNSMSEEDKNAFINKLADEEKGNELLAIAAENESKISITLPDMQFQTEYQKEYVDKYRTDLTDSLKKNLSFLDIFTRIPQETPEGNKQLAEIRNNLNLIRTGIEKISNPSFYIQQQKKIQQLVGNTLIKMGRVQDEIQALAKAVNDESKTVLQKEKAESNRKTDFSNGIEGGYSQGINVVKVKMQDGSKTYKIMSPYLPDLVNKIRSVKDYYYKMGREERKTAGIAPTFDGKSKAWYFGEGLSGQLENVLRDYLHKS